MRSFLSHQLRPAIGLVIVMTVLTGLLYPAVVTAVAQVAFPSQANGSMVVADGRTVGSVLIGQSFTDPRYLWPRPSVAGPDGYDAMASGGSNLGPTNRKLIDAVARRVADLRAANGDGPVPVDLVTASASGLDPDVSPDAAAYQVARIASARGVSPESVRAAIARHTAGPALGFLGEAHVNVLEVNLDLDGLLR